VQYPGGLAARYRWGGTGSAAEVFAITEAGGRLTDHGPLEGAAPDRLCRAELHVEGPLGAWTARFASLIYDEPEGALWDTTGLLLVKYGFRTYAVGSRTGELAWSHRSGTPVVAVLCSPSLDHCYVQSELETLALDAQGEVVWRATHNEVVIGARLIGGQLVLDSYAGRNLVLDPLSGHSAQ
jgi:outer membrane protein assembly factor BamB